MTDFIGVISKQPELLEWDQYPKFNEWNNDRMQGDYEEGVYRFPYASLVFRYSKHTDDRNTESFHYDDDKVSLVFNGRIYNINELIHEVMDNDVDKTVYSDVEVIAALFHKYKEGMFQHLRGMFSILIWDKQEEKLYGARDQFGMRPLFYTETDDTVIFASEKKGITCMLEEEVDRDALHHYLSFQYVPEPMTMTKEIKKVEPGHYFIIEPKKKVEFHRYWHSTFTPVQSGNYNWTKQIQDVLYDSVEKHIGNNRDIGAFLSGGIDSTFIAALAKEIHPQIKTFSVGFAQEGYSEVDVAKKTAEALGVENISYIISPQEYVEALPTIMWNMDDPLADPACVPLYFLTRETRKHVTSALSGEGSDELFGGYNIYREPNSLKLFNYIPSLGRKLLNKVATVLPEGITGKSFLERGTTPLSERYIGNAKMFEETEKTLFYKQYNKHLSYHDITKKLFDEVANAPLVHQMQYVDIHTWLRGDILVKASRMSMANSLEVRMPFLDKEVFDVARKLPVDLKIANGTTKHILREAARGIIPDHVLDRKKLGFPVPIRHWLKNELKDWAIELINESKTDHLFTKAYILDLLDAHCQGKGDYSRKIWTILMFMVWHQQFIEKENLDVRNEHFQYK